MAKMNWGRNSQRQLMQRHGIEPLDGDDSFLRPAFQPRPVIKFRKRLSKEEQREQAAAAFIAWRDRQQP
jgi:hypothetical protein